MRSFLLSWYGITDFRASLGFEITDGPIAAAILAEAYTDVVILSYMRTDNDTKECIETQKTFASELTKIHEADQLKDWKVTGDFVTKFANTTVAQEHFIAWLKMKIKNAGGMVNITYRSEKLRKLNDTEGIYACAMRALNWVRQEAGEKIVTLYLSPGTPVMAFVWAFAALGHPELKKRLIASPVISKPPETISLPSEWLERHGANQNSERDAANGFDVTFHLFGEQRMPALLGIRQFESNHHVFVNSKEYPATCMRMFIRGGSFEELPVPPFDASAVHEQIIRRATKLPTNSRIGFNLTGGTKLMFAGALAAARAIGAAPFYFDSRNRRVTFVDSLRNASIKPIESIDTFLHLNGDELELANTGLMEWMSPDRRLLSETLWNHRNQIAKHYKRLSEYTNHFQPFKVTTQFFTFELDQNKVATVIGAGLEMRFSNWPDFAKYLCGGWFEEYVYLQLKPYKETGLIKDIRIGIELMLNRKIAGRSPGGKATYNELDVVFTDGHSLFIVECKAGNVTQEQVMKLQNLVRIYGGVEGRGVVAACFPPYAESVRKKITDAKLTLCCGNDFSKCVNALMNEIARRNQSFRDPA